MVPGAHFTFTSNSVRYNDDVLAVTVLACSGPQRGDYTHDEFSYEVTVDVRAGSTPGAYRMDFTVRVNGGTQTVEGAFEYAPE